jgi:hypothetical protein
MKSRHRKFLAVGDFFFVRVKRKKKNIFKKIIFSKKIISLKIFYDEKSDNFFKPTIIEYTFSNQQLRGCE